MKNTQRNINNFIHYMDAITACWESDCCSNERYEQIKARLLYFGSKLGFFDFDKRYDRHEIIPGFDIKYYHTQKDDSGNYTCKNNKELILEALEGFEKLKKEALKLPQIDAIESGPFNKCGISKQDIEKITTLINDMLDIIEVTSPTRDYHAKGLMVNNLAIKMGLMSKDRLIAVQAGLAKSSSLRQPYDGSEPMPEMLAQYYDPPDTSDEKKKLEYWRTLAKNLLMPSEETKENLEQYYLDHRDYITLTDASISYGFSKAVLSKYAKKKPTEVNYLWSVKTKKHRFFRKKNVIQLAESHDKIALHRKD